ncbi:ATP-dependent RNA helicase ddx42, partial [Dinochytrium kinnereticum]
RERVIRDFKAQKSKILVSTDVAGRGLDIKSIKNVVNYDVARDIDSHVHRCGRTGRAGEKGTAYTLITKKEDHFAGELVRNLEDSSQVVSKELMDLAMKNGRFRKSRQNINGFRGGRGGLGSRGRGRGGRGGGRGRGGGGFGGDGRGGFGGRGGGGGNNPNFEPIRGGHSSGPGSYTQRFTPFQKASSSEGSSTSSIRR